MQYYQICFLLVENTSLILTKYRESLYFNMLLGFYINKKMMEGFDKRNDTTWSEVDKRGLSYFNAKYEWLRRLCKNPRYICTSQYHIHKEENTYIGRPGCIEVNRFSSSRKGTLRLCTDLRSPRIANKLLLVRIKPQSLLYHHHLKSFTLTSSQFGSHSGQKDNFKHLANWGSGSSNRL